MYDVKLNASRKYVNRKQWQERIDGSYGVIYEWFDLTNGKSYVGQVVTYRLDTREREHLKADDNCRRLRNAVQAHGQFNFIRLILDVAHSAEELDAKEIYWIAEKDCIHPNGYNLNEGGHGGGKRSKETCKKMSEAHKGKPKSGEHRKALSEASKGKPKSEAHRKAISEARKGKPKSDEHRKAMRANYPNDIIVRLKSNGTLVMVASCPSEIHEKLQSVDGKPLNNGHLSKAINGKYKSHGGYTFEKIPKGSMEYGIYN